MSIVGDMRGLIKDLSDFTAQVKTLLQAFQDGSAYLKKFHPDAKAHVAELLEQMRKTVVGLVSVSRIVTSFDFTVDGQDLDRQPSRFNDYLIAARKDAAQLHDDISSLKGSCHRVYELQGLLQMRAGDRPWWAILGDRAGIQADLLGHKMQYLYGVDTRMIDLVERMLDAAQKSLEEVRGALSDGVGGSVRAVRTAAEVLHEKAGAFRPLEEDLITVRREMDSAIAALDR